MKCRYEQFGGIISSEAPPFLAFVDRELMRELGLSDSPLWRGPEQIGLLTAPTEAHLSVTNRCPTGCGHCYMGSGDPDEGEADTQTFKRMLDALARMGVFHVALGGGEALVREDFFELAAHARRIGLVPNLTTSGACLTPESVQQMKVLGQVNVSVDGIGARYAVHRRVDRFAQADRGIDLLTGAGMHTGINAVLGRDNFEHIESIVAYAAEKRVEEVEFLRLKPAGRGGRAARARSMTHEQNIRLWPVLSCLSEKYGLTLKIDCSFVPMLCCHQPDEEILGALGTYGCEAGNVLVGARSNGRVSGCSFLPSSGLSVFDLRSQWQDNRELRRLRTCIHRIAEPCRSCRYLAICKGGCHAVSYYVKGDYDAPDPDCPLVVEYEKNATR